MKLTSFRLYLSARPNRDAVWKVVQDWRENAVRIMHSEFDRLSQLEKDLYGQTKAFGAHGLGDIIEISSDDDLQTDESDSETISQKKRSRAFNQRVITSPRQRNVKARVHPLKNRVLKRSV